MSERIAPMELTLLLLSRREQVRFVLGDSYEARIAEYMPLIEAEMKRSNSENAIDAALTLGQLVAEKDPLGVSILAAAALDMIESKFVPNKNLRLKERTPA